VFFGNEDLYDLMTNKPSRALLQFRNASSSPLGKLTVAALGIQQTIGVEKPRVFGQHAVVYIQGGEGSYRDARGWEQKLVPGDFIFVFPELEHIYNPTPGTAWRCSFLCFQGPIFDLWQESGVLNPGTPVLHREPIDVWSRKLGDVLGPSRALGSQPPLVEIGRLQEFLSAILTDPGDALLADEDRRWMERATERLETAIESKPDWAEIAKEFGLGAEGFRKRFTRLAGHPPARYRAGRLIDRACAMMCETRLTDQQIAERLGFCDEFYFSRKFKEITGKSPRAFRRGLSLRHG
jgi:AraC-like DNA-binding protein